MDLRAYQTCGIGLPVLDSETDAGTEAPMSSPTHELRNGSRCIDVTGWKPLRTDANHAQTGP